MPTHPGTRHTLPLICALSLGLVAGAVGGQPTRPADSPAPPVPPEALDPSQPPAPAVAMQTYRTLRGALDNWSVPMTPAGLRLPDCSGASIQLRLDGHLLGRASTILDGPAAFADRDAPMGSTVLKTFQQAFTEADRRLPIDRDGDRDRLAREAGSQVMLSIELAGPVTPFLPVPDNWDDFDTRLIPGIDGLAVRRGNTILAAFPGTMLSLGQTPSEAARSLVSRLAEDPGLGLNDLSAIIGPQRLVFSTFRVTHVAQGKPGGSPTFLHRGQRVADLTDVASVSELLAFRDRLATHLARAVEQAPGNTPATAYIPTRDAPSNAVAPAASSALTLLALERAAKDGHPAAAAAAAKLWSARFADGTAKPAAHQDPQAAAVVLRSGSTGGALPFDATPYRLTLGRAFVGGRFAEGTPPGTMGLLAWGLVPVDRAQAAAAVKAAFTATPAGQLVGEMPFLGFAALETAPVAADGGAPAGPASATALRQMRQEFWLHQVQAIDARPEDRDLIGGVSFTAGASPLPSWNTARPLVFIAAMLRDPALTPAAERPAETARLLQALRFLRQLEADEAQGWMHPSPLRARGGIRAAVWDQTMPSDATAMALWAVSEALESLRVVSEEQPPAPLVSPARKP
jgi:hypothetical protein